MYKSMNEVAEDINTTRAIIRKWINELQIQTVPAAGDARVKLISPEDQRKLADHIRRRQHSPKQEN